MVNYKNGKIYKIISDQTANEYIGSTAQKYLSVRFEQHKHKFSAWKSKQKGSYYWTSFDILQYEDAQIILIESFPCNSKEELLSRERHYIETSPNSINKIRNLNQTAEDKKQTRHLHYETNKTKTRDQQKEYYKKNAELLKEKSKTYHREHQKERAEKQKIYKENNKDKLNARQNEKMYCLCGQRHSRQNKLRHESSQKHRDYFDSLLIPPWMF